jgi:predicted metalloenzyme YecM
MLARIINFISQIHIYKIRDHNFFCKNKCVSQLLLLNLSSIQLDHVSARCGARPSKEYNNKNM